MVMVIEINADAKFKIYFRQMRMANVKVSYGSRQDFIFEFRTTVFVKRIITILECSSARGRKTHSIKELQ